MLRLLPLLRPSKPLYLVRFTSSYPSHPPGYENILKCKTKRWLFNEDVREYRSSDPETGYHSLSARTTLRTVEFDVEALGQIAAAAQAGLIATK